MKIFPQKKKIFIWVFVLILFVFLSFFFQKEIKNFFYLISSPIQKTLWRVGDGISDFWEAIIKIKTLKNEINELKLKNQELLAEIVALRELKKENIILREALEIELQKDFKLILTQIIGKDIAQDFILINKGSDDGILENMPVITQQKVLLGKISQVYKNFSKVMLISNKKSSFDAKIQKDENEPVPISGVVEGKGNLKIFLEFIPRDKEIFQGDIIITRSLGEVFPAGLLVGRVKEVKKSDVESFQQAEIEPFFNLSEIDYLFVVSNF